MGDLQREARAMGDPTRYAIFRRLVELGEPVDVATLTKWFGLNHNAIRQHLTQLVAASLVDETTQLPAGRGRPPLLYSVDPTAESRWGVAGPYERLSGLLAEIIRTGDSAVEVGRRAGRIGVDSSAADPNSTRRADPIGELVDQMALHGFEPELDRDGHRAEVTLRRCPFAATALVDPDTVCGLHLGLALGVADRLDGLVIDELVPNDPAVARCSLGCHVDEVRRSDELSAAD